MSATAIDEKWQTTIPADVRDAAGLQIDDQVEWRFEDGEIRVRKLTLKSGAARFATKAAALAALRSSPLKFKTNWNEMRKETREP